MKVTFSTMFHVRNLATRFTTCSCGFAMLSTFRNTLVLRLASM
jgi:hypothetical protein